MYSFTKTKGQQMIQYLNDAESEHSSPANRRQKPLSEKLKEMSALGLDPGNKSHFEKYLSLDDNHEKARVTGKLAEDMEGKKLEYSKKLFEQMTNGCREDGTSILKKSKNRQLGYSGALAVSKSVSMLYAVSDRVTQAKIREAINKADSQITDEMQKLLKPANSKAKYENFDPSKTKAVFFEFWHYEARNVNGKDESLEPHLHKHKQLMNFASFTFEDGKTKIMAIDAKEMLGATKELTAKFNTLLATELHKIGIQTEACEEAGLEHSIRIKGISREMEKSLSSRNKQIKTMTQNYEDGPEAVISKKLLEEEIAKSSRREKKITSADEIHSLINRNTSKVIDKDQLELAQESKTVFDKVPEEVGKRIAQTQGFDLQGEMSEPNVRAQIVNLLRFSKEYKSLDEINQDVDLTLGKLQELKDENRLIRKENGHFTTLKVALNEEKAIENALELSKTYTGYKTSDLTKEKARVHQFCTSIKEKEGFKFNQGQIEAMELVAQGRGITYIEGDAGTGKTTSVIRFANDMYKGLGNKVVGLSVQTKTADSLKEAGVENRFSIAKFLTDITDPKTGEFTKKAIGDYRGRDFKGASLIIDEAGMVGAEHYAKLTDFCLKTNSRLILVGDVKQLASVQHGDSLKAIEKTLAPSFKARLTENMRQKNDPARLIAEAFRDKQTDLATDLLRKNGLLETSTKKEDLYTKIADDYMKDEGKSKLVIAYNNADCDLINDQIRERLKAKGQIDSNEVTVEITRKSGNGALAEQERDFAVGDRIVFTENFKVGKGKQAERFNNADVATIKQITQKEGKVYFMVSIDGSNKQVEFCASEQKTFNHAYAVSTYKSQGQTVENAYVFGTDKMTSNSAYVNFSRHKEQVKLYIQEDDLASFKESAKNAQVKPITTEDKNVKAELAKLRQDKQPSVLAITEKRSKAKISSSHPEPTPYDKIILENKKKLEEEERKKMKRYEEMKADPKVELFLAKNPQLSLSPASASVIDSQMEAERKNIEIAMKKLQEQMKAKPSQTMKPNYGRGMGI